MEGDLEVENKQVVLKRFIEEGEPKEADFELVVGKTKLKVPKGSGASLVKNLYLSCDPYMRSRMRENCTSFPPFVLGQPIKGYGLSVVVDSDNPNFKPGDLITGFIGWEEYSLVGRAGKQLRKIEPDDGIPQSFHLGLFGVPGITAYAGFFDVCSPKKGEYVYVSSAFGAVGQLVGQLAKLHGCYVVGSAGSNQKVDLLKSKLGFDEAFNYKEEPDLNAALKRYFPQGIDIYFENVGGEMLDAVLLNMRVHGRIAVCGMVSEKNPADDPQAIYRIHNLIAKRIKMQGFVHSDYLDLYPRFLEDVIGYYKQGKIDYIQDMNEGLESAPSALVGLFSGKNFGKQMIHLADS